mmetsp:Transcript_23682/g.73786  ORF Transcript_23682/g.73786 Transcript_23682/m.73786 type:complete len:253 (+) Transcript_23682:837-1595(+)
MRPGSAASSGRRPPSTPWSCWVTGPWRRPAAARAWTCPRCTPACGGWPAAPASGSCTLPGTRTATGWTRRTWASWSGAPACGAPAARSSASRCCRQIPRGSWVPTFAWTTSPYARRAASSAPAPWSSRTTTTSSSGACGSTATWAAATVTLARSAGRPRPARAPRPTPPPAAAPARPRRRPRPTRATATCSQPAHQAPASATARRARTGGRWCTGRRRRSTSSSPPGGAPARPAGVRRPEADRAPASPWRCA